MRNTKRILVAALLLIATSGAPALAEEEVDRGALQRAALLPSVGPDGWYYVTEIDGRIHPGGSQLSQVSVSDLRERAAAHPDDATVWLDLSDAYRRDRNPGPARATLARAIALLRNDVEGEQDTQDGLPLARLGLALFAAGADDAGATIQSAKKAARNGWAGHAAEAEVIVLRAASKRAGTRFRTVNEMSRWLEAHPSDASALDRATLQMAADLYDVAVEELETAGALGPAAASVYSGRGRLFALMHHVLNAAGHPDVAAGFARRSATDGRNALTMRESDPYVRTLITLDDAMSAPRGADGVRQVLHVDALSKEAQTLVASDIAELERLTAATDTQRSSRAFEGLACVRWFIYRDRAATVKALRASVQADPHNTSAWNAFVMVVAGTLDHEQLVEIGRDWVAAHDCVRSRIVLAKALTRMDDYEEAEEHWRVAHALRPRDFDTNAGLAVLVLKRAQTDEDLAEARARLDAAASALLTEQGETNQSRFLVWSIADAVARGLSGDVDGAERVTRRLHESYGQLSEAGQILSALGR